MMMRLSFLALVTACATVATACDDIRVPAGRAPDPGVTEDPAEPLAGDEGDEGDDDDVAVPDDFIARYTFDQTLDDASGWEHHLEVDFPGPYVTDRHGYGERAYDFANSGSGIYYALMRAPNLGISLDFTIALWVKGTGQGNHARIAGQGEWFNLHFDRSGSVGFGWREHAESHSPIALDPEPHPSSTWTFYAGVVAFDAETSTSTITLYRDGEEVDSVEAPGVAYVNPGACAFYIGRMPQQGSRCDGLAAGYKLAAELDDVQVYDRALDEEEVEALYEAGW